MAKLRPWYNEVRLREDLREDRPLDASEFAVNLDHIHRAGASLPEVYRDPRQFFERTVWTKSLQTLAAQTARRLNGETVETSAVFNMATQFGGGKTHSLAALYHLARGGEHVKDWRGVGEVLKQAKVEGVPEAAVAVFVGKDFDSLSGRGGKDEPTRKTPWGEIAWQLGGMESYKAVEQHDKEFIEPKGDAIRAMLPKDRPVLILMDEIISYVSSYRSKGYGKGLYNFIDVLGEVARSLSNVAIVVSIPASELEYMTEDEADEARFKKMLDRIGKAISMSSDAEVTEIIRRRLFEWDGLTTDAMKTVTAYSEWAIEHKSELAEMGGAGGESIRELFQNSYPFHPTVISVFERKWQTLPRFQRTRGVLRLLALWVARIHREQHRAGASEPLITLGSSPLDDQIFRDAVFGQLGDDKLITPVTTDIAGKSDSHAKRLDNEATPAIKKASLHQQVAKVVFFESNGGQSQSRSEATVPELRAALGGPDLDLPDIETVLEGLVSSCYYLVTERNRYRFGLAPNLNQMVVSRRGQVRPEEIKERMRQEITNIFNTMPTDFEQKRRIPKPLPFPTKSTDVRDEPQLRLVHLGFDTPYGARETENLIGSIVREYGASGRTHKAGLIFCVPEASPAVDAAARDLLAWEDIKEDRESTSRLDDSQQRTLRASLERAKKDLHESVFRAYRHVYLLGRNNLIVHEDLGQITSSMDPSLPNLVISVLENKEIVTRAVSPRLLEKAFPGVRDGWSTKNVRDAFYASPELPRLLDENAVALAISKGVSEGILGYASKDSEDRLRLERFEEPLPQSEVEISDEVFIVKRETALRLKEPPRLTKLLVSPESIRLAPQEATVFKAQGLDQYGVHTELESVIWSADAGEIDANGRFTADADPGRYEISATAGEIVGKALIQVAAPAGSNVGGGPGPDSEQMLLWSGEIPTQKWMNFYTKVLARFANKPGLKIRVSLEAETGEDAETTVQETRTALRELGLGEDVELT